MIAGAILAAGAGTRFAAPPKQLYRLGGRPLIEYAIAAMSSAAGLGRIVVVLGAHAGEITQGADLGRATPLLARDWSTGQAAGLRAAVRELCDADAIVVTLGDQPLISPTAIERVIAASTGTHDAVRASYGGTYGHPVVLMARLFPGVLGIDGDRGARDLLSGAAVHAVDCTGLGSVADVDTIADIDALALDQRSPFSAAHG